MGDMENNVFKPILSPLSDNDKIFLKAMGQYLQPTKDNWPVSRMVSPEEFEDWKRVAENEIGFSCAVCGPLVRSSYHASEAFSSSGH